MIKVDIALDNARIFLFPASVQPTPGDGDDNTPLPPDDTTVRGEVVISSDRKTRIGPVRVVWEVARELKKAGNWGRRDVLARFESEVTDDDAWIEQGSTRLLFTFQIPSLLPPTSETVFDRTSHTLVASVLEAAPEYAFGTLPEYDDVVSCASPRESVGSFGDWSFPANSSRRSSLLTESSESRRGSIASRRSSVSSVAPSSEAGSRRSSASSRRGSSDDNEHTEIAEPKRKKSLFGGFRRKSSVTSLASAKAVEPAVARVESRPTAKVAAVAPSCDGIPLAEYLLPSTSASTKALEIVSCPTPRGEICAVDWTKNTSTIGLGHSHKYVHSNLFSLGSGVNFEYRLDDIPANTTVHNIRLSLCQKTKAANGDTDEEIFELFSRGSSTANGHNIWRGEEPRTWDVQPAKKKSSKSSTPSVAGPQLVVPGVTAGPSSLRIRTKARLPTPMAGGVPSSPKLLDNRLARTIHRLRIETFFSVLGEDESGRPLSPDPKVKNGRPREGTMRRTWVDHDVVIGSCCITPENVLVPTYSASPDRVLGEAQQRAKIQARSELAAFEMAKSCTHLIKSTSGNRSSERSERLPADAKERLARHSCETGSRCLCFHGDAVVAEMIGSLEKQPTVDTTDLIPLLVEVGGLVKSLYTVTPDCPPVQMAEIVLPTPLANRAISASLVSCT